MNSNTYKIEHERRTWNISFIFFFSSSYFDMRIWRTARFIRSPRISWTVTVRSSVTVSIDNGFQFLIKTSPGKKSMTHETKISPGILHSYHRFFLLYQFYPYQLPYYVGQRRRYHEISFVLEWSQNHPVTHVVDTHLVWPHSVWVGIYYLTPDLKHNRRETNEFSHVCFILNNQVLEWCLIRAEHIWSLAREECLTCI